MSSPIAPGNTLDLPIHALATGGKAISRLEGMVIFTDRGIPGQTVRATISRVKKRFAEATFQHTVTPAPDEIPPFCKHFGLCGGCLWQNLPYAGQLEWKRRFVEDSIRRIAGAEDISVAPVIASPQERHYRNKMEFAFLQGRGTIHLGLRRYASHSIVNIEECHLQSQRATAIVRHVRQWANRQEAMPAYDPQKDKGYLRFLVVRETRSTNQLMVQIITAPDWSNANRRNAAVAALGNELADAFPGLTSFVHSERADKAQVAYGERDLTVQGAAELHETLHIGGTDHTLCLGGAASFFQTNTGAAEILYTRALEMAALTGSETVWDLYCGVGALSLGAAARSASVTGFEITADAVETAGKNAAEHGAGNVTFKSGDVRHTMREEQNSPQVIITDPPRSGMHPEVVAAIAARAPERIVYISCDPATQARDIGLLLHAYRIVQVQPVDLFPHTPHIENIVLLHRLADRQE